jgi:hypothetical protein
MDVRDRRNGGRTLPPPIPSLADIEVTRISLTPDSDEWTAYSIVADIAPMQFEGTEFLVDPNGCACASHGQRCGVHHSSSLSRALITHRRTSDDHDNNKTLDRAVLTVPPGSGNRLPVEGSPTDEFQGINREHGADDPFGAKAVTAPVTVSG